MPNHAHRAKLVVVLMLAGCSDIDDALSRYGMRIDGGIGSTGGGASAGGIGGDAGATGGGSTGGGSTGGGQPADSGQDLCDGGGLIHTVQLTATTLDGGAVGTVELTSALAPVSVATSGSSVTVARQFCAGTFLHLHAEPDAGYFAGWRETNDLCPRFGDCDLTVATDTTVVATFHGSAALAFLTPASYTLSQLQAGQSSFFPDEQMVAGADAVCMQVGGDGGVFKAFISTFEQSALDHLAADVNHGWVLPNGLPFLNSLRVPNLVLYTPWATRDGDQPAGYGYPVWTGAGAAGTALSAFNCEDWSQTDAGFGGAGALGTGGASWYAGQLAPCRSAAPLYCFQTDAPPVELRLPPPLPGDHVVFLSSATFAANTGLTTANSLCASDAANARLSGNFRPFMCTTGMTIRDTAGFDFTTGRLVRPDGVVVSESASDVTSMDTFLATPYLTATGGVPNDYGNLAWLGCPDFETTPGARGTTCDDWTDAGSGVTYTGSADLGLHVFSSLTSTTRPCSSKQYRVLCIN